MSLPLKLANPDTSMSDPGISVMFPPLLMVNVVASTATKAVASSSVTVTAPPVRRNVPKFVTSVPWLPNVILLVPASKFAKPLTLIVVPLASMMSPPLVNSKLAASTPVSSVPVVSLMTTAPPLTFNVPKLVVSPMSPPRVMLFVPASRSARPTTVKLVPASSVMLPVLCKFRLADVFTPVSVASLSS
ncbi:hypothetical protein Rcae01_06767 [Novipirellula caenicola]|uniref:Uncharacterized protein n=1 Tax=Novipirellula caenicola TaxID=1536901 RepID=A0ABP9W2L8_9BACT